MSEFTWDSEKEDSEIYQHGITFMWIDGTSKSIQNFIEVLSNTIGHKIDFSWTAGRAHIDVLSDGLEKACEYRDNEEFMAKFIKEYDDTNGADNSIYFRRIG
jgi:hypothetical protein